MSILKNAKEEIFKKIYETDSIIQKAVEEGFVLVDTDILDSTGISLVKRVNEIEYSLFFDIDWNSERLVKDFECNWVLYHNSENWHEDYEDFSTYEEFSEWFQEHLKNGPKVSTVKLETELTFIQFNKDDLNNITKEITYFFDHKLNRDFPIIFTSTEQIKERGE